MHCAIAWDQNEKSRGGKSGEYCRSSDELPFVKLFSCQILQEENPQALCRYVEAGTVVLGPILSSCCQVLHLLPDSIFEDLFVLGIATFELFDPWNQTKGSLNLPAGAGGRRADSSLKRLIILVNARIFGTSRLFFRENSFLNAL